MITRRRLTFAYLVVVLVLTMTPAPEVPPVPGVEPFCLICGSRGAADALANVLFFAPLGLLLWRGLRWNSVAAGAVLSAAIEVAQLWIPGRFSTLGDLVFDTVGVALGAAVGWAWSRGLGRPSARWGGRLALGWMSVLWLLLGAGAALLRPAVPDRPLYGQWTAEMGGLEHYRGTVLEARVGGLDAPDGLLDRSARIGDALERGAPVIVRFVAGPPPPGPAPIFGVYDDRRRRVLFVGAEGDDVLVTLRRNADRFRLDRPELRFRDVLAGVSPGDTVAIGLERSQTSEAYRLRVDRSGRASGDGVTVATGVEGFTLARTWSVLLFSGSFPTAMILVLDLAWLAVLALPIGFWSPGWRSLTAATGGYLAGLVALPRLTTLLPASPSGYVAVLAGVAAGRWLSDLGVTFSQRYGVARATNRGNERESAGREDGGSAGFRGGCGTE